MKKKEYVNPRLESLSSQEIIACMGPATAGVYGTQSQPGGD